jgi:hypothetical protein
MEARAIWILNGLTGTPGGIRTPDLLLRRQPLYPSELQAHTVGSVLCGASQVKAPLNSVSTRFSQERVTPRKCANDVVSNWPRGPRIDSATHCGIWRLSFSILPARAEPPAKTRCCVFCWCCPAQGLPDPLTPLPQGGKGRDRIILTIEILADRSTPVVFRGDVPLAPARGSEALILSRDPAERQRGC